MKLPTAERRVRLYRGDCLAMMRAMPDDCVAATVTDPPAGIGFMNREWDDFRRQRNGADAGRDSAMGRLSRSAPQIGRGDMWNFVEFMRERMAEALRVTVPGGLALVWAHPKTEDWTSIACRLAGWERVGWCLHLFGSGMPKGFLKEHLARQAGVPEARRKHMNTTFRVPAVEPWLVFVKPSKDTAVANLVTHGTGYFPIGDYRVPRERIRAVQGMGSNTNALTRHNQQGQYDNSDGTFPLDVELVCAVGCSEGNHTEGCPIREVAMRGPTSKGQSRRVVRRKRGARNGMHPDSSQTVGVLPGDSGDCSRYFHRHTPEDVEDAYAIYTPKAKGSLRLTADAATARDVRDGWRLFVVDEAGDLVEFPGVDAWNGWAVAERVRIRATSERHRWCEHLLWLLDSSSPVGLRRVGYREWMRAPEKRRRHGNAHPTVKAQKLVRPLVATAVGCSTDPHPLVLDPFGGSGAVAQAALALGCRVITAEQDPIVGWPIITAKLTGLAASGGIGGVDA